MKFELFTYNTDGGRASKKNDLFGAIASMHFYKTTLILEAPLKKKNLFFLSILLILVLLTSACTGMKTDETSQQQEQEKAVAVIVALTQTAIVQEKEVEVVETPIPDDPDSGLSPLVDNCENFKMMIEPELKLMVSNQIVPVEHSWSDETGTACQLTALANGNDFTDILEPSDQLKQLLVNNAWIETMESPCLGYGGSGPGADSSCFINQQETCELLVSLSPVDRTLCPEDKPIDACLDLLSPEQKIFTIQLTCAQGVNGMLAYAADEPFSLDVIESMALTGVPYMLPTSFPTEDSSLKVYPYFNFRDAEIYEISLDYAPDCYGASACHYGVILGKQADGPIPTGTVNYPYMPEQGRQVSLAKGLTGYFMEANCGASCGDASVYWLYDGYEYMVGLKAGSMESVITLANEMIMNSIQ